MRNVFEKYPWWERPLFSLTHAAYLEAMSEHDYLHYLIKRDDAKALTVLTQPQYAEAITRFHRTHGQTPLRADVIVPAKFHPPCRTMRPSFRVLRARVRYWRAQAETLRVYWQGLTPDARCRWLRIWEEHGQRQTRFLAAFQADLASIEGLNAAWRTWFRAQDIQVDPVVLDKYLQSCQARWNADRTAHGKARTHTRRSRTTAKRHVSKKDRDRGPRTPA